MKKTIKEASLEAVTVPSQALYMEQHTFYAYVSKITTQHSPCDLKI